MACKLTKSSKANVDFEGKTDDVVNLAISSDSGGATIVTVIYDGSQIDPPSNFTLVAGNKLLTILVDNPVPRDWTTILEKCNGGTNIIKHYPFDPFGPTQTFRIEAS